MSRKATIAILATAAMALAAAPSGASAAEKCAPGTSSGEYCEATETTGLSTKEHKTSPTNKDKAVDITLRCSLSQKCKGKLQLLSVGGGKAAKHMAVYGTQDYSIKAKSKKTVKVNLDPKGRKALQRKGKLTVVIVAISEGVRERIGTLRIKGKKSSHSTHADSEPGFTG